MLTTLLVVVHVWAVLWLVAGIVGRDVCYWQAGRANDLAALLTVAQLAGTFERAMVRPATFVVLITGLIRVGPGLAILGFLQGGTANWVLTALLIYLSVIPLIVFVFLPKGRVYRKALKEAVARDEVTPELGAAINDPLVGAARAYEIVMDGALVFLMLTRNF